MIMQLCGLLNFTSKCHAGLEHRSWSTGRHTQGALVLMWADKPSLIKMELEYVPIWSWKANWQHPYSHVALLKDELRLICINLFFSPILRMLPQNLRAKQVGNLIWFCGTNGNSLAYISALQRKLCARQACIREEPRIMFQNRHCRSSSSFNTILLQCNFCGLTLKYTNFPIN